MEEFDKNAFKVGHSIIAEYELELKQIEKNYIEQKN